MAHARRDLVLLAAGGSTERLGTGSGATDDVAITHGDSLPGTGGLHVVMGTGGANGHLEDGGGAVVRLHGADRAGTEYPCLYGDVFDGPADQAAIDVMKTWHLDAVRVPLNEDCWLGINATPRCSSTAACT